MGAQESKQHICVLSPAHIGSNQQETQNNQTRHTTQYEQQQRQQQQNRNLNNMSERAINEPRTAPVSMAQGLE